MSTRLLKSTRGKPMQVVNGFTMLFHRDNTSHTRFEWRCSKFHKGCSARGVSSTLAGAIVMTSGAATTSKHNHVPDPVSPQKRQRSNEVKQAAINNKTTPSMSLAADAHEGLQPFELQQFPSQRAFQQVVNRARKVEGSRHTDAEPSKMIIPDEMAKTLRGDQFLVVDTRKDEPDKPVILGFCSPFGKQLLRENAAWAVDGTFYAAAKHWNQLFTINVLIGQSSFPAAYLLLPNKEQATYARALKALFALDDLNGVSPASFIADFELALKNAMVEQFPNARVKHCHYHLSAAVFNNIQKRRLLPLYDIDDVRAILRCFAALAVLPPEDVPNGFKDCKDVLDELLQDGVIDRKYGADLNGWHAFLNALFPRSKMALSQFIVRVQKEDERNNNLVTRHEVNPASHIRGKPSNITVREQNLRQLVAEYSELGLQLRQERRLLHLLKCQYHLSPTAFSRVQEEVDGENATPTNSQGITASQQSASGSQSSQGSGTSRSRIKGFNFLGSSSDSD